MKTGSRSRGRNKVGDKNSNNSRTVKGYQDIPLESLVKAPWNYKVDDEALAEKLKANIQRNGQIENLVVRELPKGKYEIVNGNHRFDVMLLADISVAHCFNVGNIPLGEAKRLAIELNETRFERDDIKLAGIIAELIPTFTIEELSGTMPFTINELQSYEDLSKFEWSPPEVKPQVPSDNSSTKVYICFNCGAKGIIKKDTLVQFESEEFDDDEENEDGDGNGDGDE